MNVKELIKVLGKHNQDEEIMVTWESTFHEIDDDSVYCAANGIVIIDADGNWYKEEIQKGERVP